jgi:hypothetical protein
LCGDGNAPTAAAATATRAEPATPDWFELVVRLSLASINGLPYCRVNATQTRQGYDRDARKSISE